jgi:hypothetical protein
MQKKNIKIIFGILLLLLVLSIAVAYSQIDKQAEEQTNDSSVKLLNMDLTKEGGILLIPTDNDSIADLSTTPIIEKNASAVFSGTIDENNHVILEGTISIDEEEENVKLSGEAYQVFIGWNVPEGAEPIYTKVGHTTMTRYEGATERYATYVDLIDSSEKYNLHGEFYDDGSGGFVGFVYLDGKQCQIGLIGNSMSMYENVTPDSNETEEHE